MFAAIFAMACAALTVLTLLLVLTAFTDAVKLWPTPSPHSWQSYVFWPLFRGGLGLTILLGLWTLIGAPAHGWEAAVGALLALSGLGLTIYGYFDLGIEKTYGKHDGLVTSGLYRYSRNPQYVTSILGFSGLAIAAGSPAMALLCVLAIGVYILLPSPRNHGWQKPMAPAMRHISARRRDSSAWRRWRGSPCHPGVRACRPGRNLPPPCGFNQQ